MTSRSIRVESNRVDSTIAPTSKCLANRLPVWRVDINRDESFDSTILVTPFRGHLREIFEVSFKSTSGMTGRHQLWQVVGFDNTFNDLWYLLAEYFLRILQIDFQCDGSTLTVASRSTRVELEIYMRYIWVINKCEINRAGYWLIFFCCTFVFEPQFRLSSYKSKKIESRFSHSSISTVGMAFSHT